MNFFKNTFGYFLAAVIINGFWGSFTNKFGNFGAYGAAFFLTGSMWYINHYIGLIKHDKDSAFIDMALGIAICLITKSYIINGANSLMSSIPTFILVVIGATFGGIAAVWIEKNIIDANHKKENYVIRQTELIDKN